MSVQGEAYRESWVLTRNPFANITSVFIPLTILSFVAQRKSMASGSMALKGIKLVWRQGVNQIWTHRT
jgi:hypothetical protein